MEDLFLLLLILETWSLVFTDICPESLENMEVIAVGVLSAWKYIIPQRPGRNMGKVKKHITINTKAHLICDIFLKLQIILFYSTPSQVLHTYVTDKELFFSMY